MSGMASFVLDWQMILSVVVGKIDVAGGPVESELALGFVVAEPPELHIHELDVLFNDGVIDNSDGGSGVVGLYGRLELQSTHFDE